MENKKELAELAKLIKSYAERFAKREGSNPFHSMLCRKTVFEKKENINDAEDSFKELVGKYEFLPDGDREGIDAMLVNICGWRLKSILVKGVETMSEECFQAIQEQNARIKEAAIKNGNTLVWAINPEDKEFVAKYLTSNVYKDIDERLSDCFEWFIQQMLSDSDASDDRILRDYFYANIEQKRGMNLVNEMICGMTVEETLREILKGKNDYEIRRNKFGEMLYIDAKELVDQCIDLCILDGEKGEYVACYIDGCDEFPSGWYKRAYEDYIHELMADDEGIRYHLQAIEEAGEHFAPSLSDAALGTMDKLAQPPREKESLSSVATVAEEDILTVPAQHENSKAAVRANEDDTSKRYSVTFEVKGAMSFSVVAPNAEEARKKALDAMEHSVGDNAAISERTWELKSVSNVASGKTYFL